MSLASGIGGTGERDLRIAMMLNNNGQAITLASDFADAGYADLDAAGEILRSRSAPALAMTFPGGTHDLWLRYWMKATGTDAAALQIQPIPPAADGAEHGVRHRAGVLRRRAVGRGGGHRRASASATSPPRTSG